MADVNWQRHNCNMCLAVGLAAAAVVSAGAAWFLSFIGIPIIPLAILFLVVWGLLLMAVDGWCALNYGEGAATAQAHEPSDAHQEASAAEVKVAKEATSADASSEAAAAEKAEAEAKAAEEASKAKAADEAARKAAEEAAAAKAAEEAAKAKAAEEAAEAAAEKAAAEEQAAAEKAAAEAKAAEEAAEAERKAALAAKASEAESKPEATDAGSGDGARPEALDGPRDGVADDLKRIKGIGPKLEQVCNALGFYHFEQIANWTPDEIAWVDSNLEGFRGRVTRDDWVAQAKLLAGGGNS